MLPRHCRFPAANSMFSSPCSPFPGDSSSRAAIAVDRNASAQKIDRDRPRRFPPGRPRDRGDANRKTHAPTCRLLGARCPSHSDRCRSRLGAAPRRRRLRLPAIRSGPIRKPYHGCSFSERIFHAAPRKTNRSATQGRHNGTRRSPVLVLAPKWGWPHMWNTGPLRPYRRFAARILSLACRSAPGPQPFSRSPPDGGPVTPKIRRTSA